ncbi:MAG: hypothetical protein RJB01_181 [Actinomycetota bacterium]
MRAGDSDRDQTINVLREAFAEGRLTQSEFDDRLTRAHGAKTYGELAQLTSDLPVVPAEASPIPTSPDKKRNEWRKAWASWAGVSILVNIIWVGTWLSDLSNPPYYWPIWVMGPWAGGMLIGQLVQRADRG